MFTFRWNYDYGTVKALYDGNWRRLNHCSAAIAHVVDEDSTVKIDSFYFNSYVTPIMMIKVVSSPKSYNVKPVITICVNDECFGCSRTTIAQTNKFLDYVDDCKFFPYRYSDIKAAIKRMKDFNSTYEAINGAHSPIVIACSESNMTATFKKQVGNWTYDCI